MSGQVKVRKGVTEMVSVKLGFDVSTDIITSQIRAEPNKEATLIAEWDVDYLTDGTDGELILTMSHTITSQITATSGYMDFRRFSGTEPLAVISTPLEVVFEGVVTYPDE